MCLVVFVLGSNIRDVTNPESRIIDGTFKTKQMDKWNLRPEHTVHNTAMLCYALKENAGVFQLWTVCVHVHESNNYEKEK